VDARALGRGRHGAKALETQIWRLNGWRLYLKWLDLVFTARVRLGHWQPDQLPDGYPQPTKPFFPFKLNGGFSFSQPDSGRSPFGPLRPMADILLCALVGRSFLAMLLPKADCEI
jgi:hypothetical protein